jgi:hypothetical protein
MRSPLYTSFLLAALTCVPPPAFAADPHRRLHVQQQQDALDLQLRQSAQARRHALRPSDARRLDHLQLQQRMDQQQLELQQIQRERALSRSPGTVPPDVLDRRLDTQREVFAQERALQLQRFELDRQRLLQSMPREPLQPPLGSPQLHLP